MRPDNSWGLLLDLFACPRMILGSGEEGRGKRRHRDGEERERKGCGNEGGIRKRTRGLGRKKKNLEKRELVDCSDNCDVNHYLEDPVPLKSPPTIYGRKKSRREKENVG